MNTLHSCTTISTIWIFTIFSIYQVQQSYSFSIHLPQRYNQNYPYQTHNHFKPLYMAGFGNTSTSSSSKKNKSKTQKIQTRSVSGHTGSGTKPLREAANTFDALRKEYGKESCNDIYIRSPKNDKDVFWFAGKTAICTDLSQCKGSIIPTANEAVLCQKRLILEYAIHQLRPQNLGGPYQKSLELWIAPGDSEMDAVQNKISLIPVKGSAKDIREGFHMKDVGFNPEIYIGDEVNNGGLRIVRDDEGHPVKAVFSINDGVE